MGDLNVIVYIFSKVLNLLSSVIHILVEWRKNKKALQFVNLIVLCQIFTEDLCKKCYLLSKKCKYIIWKKW